MKRRCRRGEEGRVADRVGLIQSSNARLILQSPFLFQKCQELAPGGDGHYKVLMDGVGKPRRQENGGEEEEEKVTMVEERNV